MDSFYTDLTNKPTIPDAQVPSDWNASSGVSRILNKPTLFSGAYADLSGKPTLFSGSYVDLTNKPSFATVATTGSYNDLTNKPTIPKEFVGTANVTSAGNAVFYLTNDGTSGGTATFTSIQIVSPIINDSTLNYTYGWSYNATTKALTVNAKVSTGINVALLNLTLLGIPANVANGTSISVLVKGI